MLKSNLCDYSDVYILVKGAISFANTADTEIIFESCAPFTDCTKEINNIQSHHAKDIRIVMTMYNLRTIVIIIQKYQKSYGNTTEINVDFFAADNNSASFSLNKNNW